MYNLGYGIGSQKLIVTAGHNWMGDATSIFNNNKILSNANTDRHFDPGATQSGN